MLNLYFPDSSGAAIGFIFKAQTAPRYFEGLYFALGMVIMSTILTIILVRYRLHLEILCFY